MSESASITGRELCDATERLNDLLKQVQSDLIRGNLGVEAFVLIDAKALDGAESSSFAKYKGNIDAKTSDGAESIGFVKCKSNVANSDWSLVYVRSNGEQVSLLQAERHERIRASFWLAKLRRQLTENARTTAAELRNAIEAVERLLPRSEP